MNPPLIVDFLASKGIPMMGGTSWRGRVSWSVLERVREQV